MYEEYTNEHYKLLCDNKTQTFTNFVTEKSSEEESDGDNEPTLGKRPSTQFREILSEDDESENEEEIG